MAGTSRYIVAVLMGLTYVMLTLSPLAPLAMKSPRVAHAVTGECSGNCNICGCSAERRASHTCCCWMKKMKHQHDTDNASCCKKKMPHRMAMISSSCPCESGKTPFLPGAEINDHLPNRPLPASNHFSEDNLLPSELVRFIGLKIEPPDPPPKLPIIA